MTISRPSMRFERTGEDRPPKRGEWYWGAIGPAMAERDFTHRCLPILERLDDGPRCEEELEAERAAAERKAVELERREAFHQRHETGIDPAKVTAAEPAATLPGNSVTSPQARRSAPAADRYLPYSDPED